MLKITTSNGKVMRIPDEQFASYFCCDECHKNVIRYWNDKKVRFSEVYVSDGEMTALALRGLPHYRDIDHDVKQEEEELQPIDDFHCQECSSSLSTKIEFYPSPPNEDDYEGAYGEPFKRH